MRLRRSFLVLSITVLSSFGCFCQEELSFYKADSVDSQAIGKFDLDALPGIMAPFTSSVIVPSIKLTATRLGIDKNNVKYVTHAFDLFIAKEPTLNKDSLSGKEVFSSLSRNLWIPEASSFFFRYRMTNYFHFNKGKAKPGTARGSWGLTYYYLNKQLPGKSSENLTEFDQVVNVGVSNFQLNWRYFLPKGDGQGTLATFYADYNIQFALNNVAKYKDYFDINNKASRFLKLGIQVGLGNDKDAKTEFYFDLGFIIQTGRVDDVIGNDDVAIPVIKLSLKPGF